MWGPFLASKTKAVIRWILESVVFGDGRTGYRDTLTANLQRDATLWVALSIGRPAGWLGTGPRGPWSRSWGSGTSHQTPTSSAGRALPHSQHRQAPPAIRKTGCQPPRAECDILSKQASCFTALPWKTSKTYRLQNQRLPVINSFLHLRYLVGGGREKS